MALIFVLVLVSLVWVFPAAYLTIAVWRSGDFSKAQKIMSTFLLRCCRFWELFQSGTSSGTKSVIQIGPSQVVASKVRNQMGLSLCRSEVLFQRDIR